MATTNPHEMLVGLFACAATILFTLMVARSAGIEMEIRAADLAQAVRIPQQILKGISEILVVLAHELTGGARADSLFRVAGFDSSKHDPVKVARSVMAVTFTTAAPNFIVVGIDPSQSRMLFHQIQRTPVSKITQALGAKS